MAGLLKHEFNSLDDRALILSGHPVQENVILSEAKDLLLTLPCDEGAVCLAVWSGANGSSKKDPSVVAKACITNKQIHHYAQHDGLMHGYKQNPRAITAQVPQNFAEPFSFPAHIQRDS